MAEQLEHNGWPVLERMSTRDGMLDQIRNRDLGRIKPRTHFGDFYAQAEALLLMDQGPSDALEANLRYALEHAMPEHRYHAALFDEWARAQAEAAG